MIPIGRGQRTHHRRPPNRKTSIAIDTIINQRSNFDAGDPVLHLRSYRSKGSTVAAAVNAENMAQWITRLLLQQAADPAAMRYYAPFTGTAIGRFSRYGRNVGGVRRPFQTSRGIRKSLILRRPSGREAYQGIAICIAFAGTCGAHHFAEEMAVQMNDLPKPEGKVKGGGSLATSLLNAGGDVSAYIPTNVISITDGRFSRNRFVQQRQPSCHNMVSVSRGGNAQIKSMKKWQEHSKRSGAISELEAFSTRQRYG